ncbi:hypothetical protein GCK72_023227 [Caenorhabditis remanei]|uniref:Uncharacterized protein n=1 Tax=Caenorhabditis remanei TaxID=31234 RepID=A0A6A5FVT7_CAERE|nr:hypothetical protein GCK72_023227 [Caenorhabditis remanei]KAF1746770.1 hypothetical protein GCK72_023227 [Caenorhabditis remanei]
MLSNKRPKETFGQQQHFGESAQYQNEQNGYQGNGHGNHAGHPIYNGEKQSGHTNGNGGYETYGHNSGSGNHGRYGNRNGQHRQPTYQNMPPPMANNSQYQTNWSFQGPPVYGNGNRYGPPTGYGMNRGYQQYQAYTVPLPSQSVSQNMMPPPVMISQQSQQQGIMPQQQQMVPPQPMYMPAPNPTPAPAYTTPPSQFPHMVTLSPHSGFNGMQASNPHQMSYNPVSQPPNQPNGHQEKYIAPEPIPPPPQIAINIPPKKEPKPALFVNPAFASANGEVQVYQNADGYSEIHSSVPQNQHNAHFSNNQTQPVKTETPLQAPPSIESKANLISPNSVLAASPSDLSGKVEEMNLTNSNSDSPSSLSNSMSEEVRTPSPVETVEELQPQKETKIESEQISHEENTLFVEEIAESEQRPLETYIFNALNFPLVAKRNLSEAAAEEYVKLIGDVQDQVKTFFRKYPDAWESANVSNRITAPAIIQDYDGFEEERVSNPGLDDSQKGGNGKKLKIEFFMSKKDVAIPEGRESERDFSKMCFDSPRLSATFEKYIKDTPKTVKLEDDHFSINLNKLEHEQMAELLKTGQRATIIMYTEFPNAEDDGDNSDNSTRPSSPEFPLGASSSRTSSSSSASRSAQPSTSTSGSTQPDTNTVSSSGPSTSNGCSLQPQRSSRFSTFTTQGLPSNRGRSTSSMTYPTNMPTLRTNPMRQGHPPLTRQPAPLFDDRLPGPSHRRLPEIPPQYRNGNSNNVQNGRVGEHHTLAQISGQAPPPVNREEQQQQLPQPPPRLRPVPVLRRRHQSHESTIRQMDGIFPRAWIHDHELLRFIIPTQREFMARVPFPPYRIPLIGVARRAPGVNYIPHRTLPSHENFEEFRRRMLEHNDDVNDPEHVRGSGPLLLEPRGFWYPTEAEMEALERRHQTELAARALQKWGPDGPSCSNSQSLSEKDKEKKKKDAAQGCRNEPFANKHNNNSDDDDDDEDTRGYSCPSASSSSYSKHSSTSSGASTSGHNERNSQSTPTSTKQKERPVKDTAHKNQKRREKELLRAQRKKEEKEKMERAISKKEEKMAKQKIIEEKKKIQEEELARQQELEELRLREEDEQKKLREEEQKSQKRRLMNLINREKKKRSKINKFEAKRIAEEEEKERLAKVREEIDKDTLEKLLQAKYLLIENTRERIQQRMNPNVSKEDEIIWKATMDGVVTNLCRFEMLDMRPIRDRSEKIARYFDLDPAFHKDARDQLTLPEKGRFRMSEGICSLRELDALRRYQRIPELKYVRAIRQYRYWKEHMYQDLSLFINYTVGISEPDAGDPTIELFEEWAIYHDDYEKILTQETVL